MKEIPLTKGHVALVDDADYAAVARHSWYAKVKGRQVYAMSRIGGKRGRVQSLHRFLLGYPTQMVDHIDGDGLNNRRVNLRCCTNGQNLCGTRRKQRDIPYVGVVHYYKGQFAAQIFQNGKHHWLGAFPTAERAAQAYNEGAKRLHGEFARLNPLPALL